MKKYDFDFKKHQHFNKSWKMAVRFIIYTLVLIFLIAFIFFKTKTKPDDNEESAVDSFEIEITEPQSE